MANRPLRLIFLAITALAVFAVSVMAVPNPFPGTSSPDGRFIYIADQTNHRIRVIDANLITRGTEDATYAVIQNVPVTNDPTSLVVNSKGTELFAMINDAVASPYYSHINSYTIEANGTLTLQQSYQIPDKYSAPRGAALSPSGNYLYVADQWSYSDGRRVQVINVTDPLSMSRTTYMPVPGSNMNIFGVAVNPSLNRLYVTVNRSDIGQVLTYSIVAENSPSGVGQSADMASGTCPSASLMKVSSDGTRLFVRVNQTAFPYTDVKVFNTATNALVANIIMPSPADHSLNSYDPSSGYTVTAEGHTNADYANYNAGLDIDATGKYLFFNHYVGQSGDGMWHWKIKMYMVEIGNYTNMWETNGGVGFHSGDTVIMSARNRLWSLYSDGGQAQCTPFMGPAWVSHFNVTSMEAMVNWAGIPYAASYVVSYEVNGSGVFTNVTVPATTTEAHLTGLTKMTLYNVRVRANATLEVSDWSPNLFVGPHQFYTLEQVWVSHYSARNNGATIVFGPLISKNVMNVPYAVRYDLIYRVMGTGGWTTVSVSPPIMDNGSNYIYSLSGLTANTSYEVKMRSVDSLGGVSDWSGSDYFRTVNTPWINAYNPGKDYSWIEWGSSDGTKNVTGVTTYELSYKKVVDSTWIPYAPTPPLTTEVQDDILNPNLNIHFTGNSMDLTQFTTYEVKIRGEFSNGTYTDWSNTSYFFTWWTPVPSPTNEMGGPRWVSHYNVMANSAYLNCEYLFNPTVQYEIQYRSLGGSWATTGLFTQAARDNAGDINPNKMVSGLTASTTYEVKARAYNGTYYSGWSGTDYFYTLERPWVDWYTGTTTGETFITWGPEISAGLYVPNATGYLWRYRVNGGSWTVSTEVMTNSTRKDPNHLTSSDNLNFRFMVTQANSTYEIEMRSRDASGGVSDWSKSVIIVTGPIVPPNPFPEIFRPWIGHYGVTTTKATMQWGWTGPKPAFDHYVMSFSTNGGTTWTDFGTSLLDTMHDDPTNLVNPTYNWGSLTPLTTYEVRLRAVNASGVTIGNPSAIDTFHTYWQLWTDKYHVGNTSAYIMWGPTIAAGLNHYEMQYKKAVDSTWIDYVTPPQTTPTPLSNTSVATPDLAPVLNAYLNNLTTLTTYEVRMRAVDNSGFIGDWSTTLLLFTSRGPWWLNVKNVDSNNARLYWENLMPGITQYEVRYSSTDATALTGKVVPLGQTLSTSEVSVSGLVANTTYYAIVRGIVGGVPTEWSPVCTFFTMKGPGWVDNFLTRTTQTQFTWEAITPAASYEISYGTNVNATGNLTDASSFTTPVTGLTGRTWYYAKIRVHNGTYASNWSPITSFFTIPVPNNVQWIGSTATTANITWEPVDMGLGAMCSSYEVSWGLIQTADGSGDAMTGGVTKELTGLTTGKTYYVKVRARDDLNLGYSDWAPYPFLAVVATDEAIINSIDGSSGFRGTTILIRGTNFGVTVGTITIGGVTGIPGYWKNNEIAVSVPPTAPVGSNSIVVVTNAGKTATHVGIGAPYTFNVVNGGWVLDDYEGGNWQYTTWETGAGNSVTYTKTYSPPAPERNTYATVETGGTAKYEIFGGVSPYGAAFSQNGFSLAGDNKLSFLIKNNGGSTLVATFELIETNQAPLNNLIVDTLAVEVWRYNVPITVEADGLWHKVSIDLTTEGTVSFEINTDGYKTSGYTGNWALDWGFIRGFQIVTAGNTNPKRFSIDRVVASNESGVLTGSKTFTLVYNGLSNTSDNWISIPFDNPVITSASQLAAAMGLPPGSLIERWDPINQGFDYSYYVDMGMTDFPVGVGTIVRVGLGGPTPAFTITGTIPGSETGLFNMAYNGVSNTSDNWIYVPNSKSSTITSASQLAIDMALPPGSLIEHWDAVNQGFDYSYYVDMGMTDFTLTVGDPVRVGLGNTVPIWP